MHKTLLLCFIHGFKGDNDTFGGFPRHLATLLGHALPNISIKAITYPKYETRGDLLECVARFREWLQNQVIDIEVDAGTPSPTIDPSVHVVLVGHSMGGVVAAETLLSIVADEPIKSMSASRADEPLPSSTTNTTATSTSVPPQQAHANTNSTLHEDAMRDLDDHDDTAPPSPSFLFPYIAGVLAFDTPYLGISPGVLAYGAESKYRTASSAYNTISSAASAFGSRFGSASSSSAASASTKSILAGPESAKEALSATADAAAVPAWTKWGKVAMFAGVAGAVVAGGAAAYTNRDSIQKSWGWVNSHLEFVGCLMRGEELKRRVGRMADVAASRDLGFVDMYTVLGKGAGKTEGISVAGGWVEVGGDQGRDQAGGRTFCALPKRPEWQRFFEPCVNHKVAGEIEAHVSMFFPRDNPGFYDMADRARDRVMAWVDKGWYQGSEPRLGTRAAEEEKKKAASAPSTQEDYEMNFDAAGTEEEPVLID